MVIVGVRGGEGLGDGDMGDKRSGEKDLKQLAVNSRDMGLVGKVAYIIQMMAAGSEQVVLKKPCLAQEYYNVRMCVLRVWD